MIAVEEVAMSRCAYCKGHCTAGGDEKSHGICQDCLMKVSPNCPPAKKHAEAMKRGRRAAWDAGIRAGFVEENDQEQRA